MPENWITLVSDDVLSPNSKEKASIVAIKGLDDLPAIVEEVSNQVREAYRSGGRELGPDGTIPDGLKQRAIAIALWKFLAGVAKNDGIHTREREGNYKEATDYLASIARREVTSAGGAEIVTGEKRVATRDRLKGL